MGKDRRFCIIRCRDLLGKDGELGNEIVSAYSPNKEHQYCYR
jgi:hypothetical protein